MGVANKILGYESIAKLLEVTYQVIIMALYFRRERYLGNIKKAKECLKNLSKGQY